MEASSQTATEHPTEPGILATAFTAKGRVGRLRYFIYLMSYCPVLMILGIFAPLYVIGIFMVIANYICATIRRCHDIALSGWWALVLGLPGPNLVLLVVPGREPNRYGEQPASIRSERLVALVMLLLTIGACGVYYLYVFRPAIQAYETRNAIGGAPWEKHSGESPIVRLSFTAPTTGSITLQTGQQIPMNYRGRYRTLYVSFTVEGVSYTEQLQHNVQLNRLDMIDGDAVTGTYER